LPIAHLKDIACVVHRRGIAVVREANVGADEDAVFDSDPGRDERKSLDLDVSAKHGATLYLDERGDFGVVADLAAIEVHLVRMVNHDTFAQLDVRCDHGRISITLRAWPMDRS